MPPNPVATTPCAKCKRPVAQNAKRCMYCGAPRFTAAPGTPEREAEEKAALEDEKKLKQQAALFQAGVGMGKGGKGSGGGTDQRNAGILKALIMLFINPIATFKILREIFRP